MLYFGRFLFESIFNIQLRFKNLNQPIKISVPLKNIFIIYQK